MVPAKKREEWLRLKQEKEKQEKIDRAMAKETEKLKKMIEEKMLEQDETFLVKL